LLECVKEKNFTALSHTLNTVDQSLYFRYMKTSIKTLKKHLPYIKHSLIYPYNNGRIEGINNKIKVLNRVAYGYRNFRSEEHTSELQSRFDLVCRLLLE